MRTLTADAVHRGALILVNSAHPFRTATPDDLVPAGRAAHVLLREEAATQLRRVLAHIQAENTILPFEGFRSRLAQAALYQDSLAINGPDFTARFVAPAGCSEHESGLAIDLALNAPPIDPICPSFPDEGLCHIFRKIAPRFGFVERYPTGKESITGIAHEPWHFRYVGTPHARLMTLASQCLEEYLPWLAQYTEARPLYVGQNHHPDASLFFVPQQPDGSVTITRALPPRYSISGNNIDGVIVTAWGPLHD